MGPEPDPEYLAEEQGDVRYKTPQAAAIEARLHPLSTHLHPSTPNETGSGSERGVEVRLRPPGFGGSALQNALVTLERNERSRMAIAKGYTGDPCGECGQLTMVRNGTCLKCDSCGATSGCS
jgi:hypothetical protein